MSVLLFSALLVGSQATEPVRIDLIWDGETCGTAIGGVPISQDDLDLRARQWVREEREVTLRGTD